MQAIAAALTVLLLTEIGSDADDALAPVVAKAARESLGADAQVVTRRLSAFPADATAAALGAELHADAVVELTWLRPDNPTAIIHLMRSKTGRWVDRELAFKPVDAPAERGRTVGFTIASMVPDRPDEQAAAPSRSPAPSGSREREHAAPPVHAAAPYGATLDAMGIAGLAMGDAGGGLGGAIDLRLRLAPILVWRTGLAVRTHHVAAAQTTTWFFSGGTGIAVDMLSSREGRRALGLRIDGLLVRQEFAHLSSDDLATHYDGKWLSGADLLLEANWFFTERAGVAAGAGAEAVFGKTDIIVRGQGVATIRPVRPVLEIGFRDAILTDRTGFCLVAARLRHHP